MRSNLRTIQSSTLGEIWNPLPVRLPPCSRYDELTILESDTRRQAATEFTRALMEHFERDVTEIIKGYISTFLQVCHRND
jgi:hypothetical protein